MVQSFERVGTFVPVSVRSNQVSTIRIRISKFRDQRLPRQIRPQGDRMRKFALQRLIELSLTYGSVTRFVATRKCTGETTVVGWLQRIRTGNVVCKMPFEMSDEFGLILERLGTGDFRAPAAVAGSERPNGSLAKILDISNRIQSDEAPTSRRVNLPKQTRSMGCRHIGFGARRRHESPCGTSDPRPQEVGLV
jgi:hypothetical protein